MREWLYIFQTEDADDVAARCRTSAAAKAGSEFFRAELVDNFVSFFIDTRE